MRENAWGNHFVFPSYRAYAGRKTFFLEKIVGKRLTSGRFEIAHATRTLSQHIMTRSSLDPAPHTGSAFKKEIWKRPPRAIYMKLSMSPELCSNKGWAGGKLHCSHTKAFDWKPNTASICRRHRVNGVYNCAQHTTHFLPLPPHPPAVNSNNHLMPGRVGI